MSALTVADVAALLGSAVLRLSGGATAAGARTEVSHAVDFDPCETLAGTPGGILLLIGAGPDSPSLPATLTDAGVLGYAAVALKTRGRPLPDDLLTAASAAGIAVLEVDDGIPWRHLGDLINAVTLSPADDGAQTSGQELFALANTLAETLGGAVAIEDVQRSILAYSTIGPQILDSVRRDGILARRVPDSEENPVQYGEVMRRRDVVRFGRQSGGEELARYATAVRAGERPIGSIWVIKDPDLLDAAQQRILLDGAKLAAIHLLRAENRLQLDFQVRDEWLRALLDGQGTAESTGRAFGLAPGRTGLLVAIGAGEDAGTLAHEIALAARPLSRLHSPLTSVTVIGTDVWVFVPDIADEERGRRIASRLQEGLAARFDRRVCAAFGLVSHEPEGTSFAEARAELSTTLAILLGETSPSLTVATRRDVGARHILFGLAGLVEGVELAADSDAARIRRHDSEHRTDYAHTLLIYFECLGDARRTAERLGIHHNTLRYRISRARELFGLDLDDPDSVLVLWLLLRLD